MFKKSMLVSLVAILGAAPAIGQVVDEDEPRSSNQSPTLNFVGDRYRIGVGIDSEFDVIGEFLASFHETSSSAWLGEGWLGRQGAGGVKLNYHWLFGGESEDGPDGPVYVDGHVAKLFVAADQNQLDDRKLTFGGGYEHDDWFASAYGMRALSSERLVNQTVDIEQLLVEGQMDGRGFTRMDTLERVNDIFEAPYDWGVGVRAGRYFDGQLVRVRGGLDYEDGDHGASQLTASVSLDKHFSGTPHSLSLRTGYARKRGDLVDDRNDLRGSLVYGYSFGRSHQPARRFRDQEFEVEPEPRVEERVVSSELTLADEATFDFDSANLRPAARETLDEVAEAIREGRLVSRVSIIGHTCDIGPAEYNQGLSERRAQSVVDYLTGRGIDSDEINWEGRGENDPRYPNDSEENRSRNRRVEISFVTEESRTERVEVGPDEPVTEIRQVEIPTEAAWIRRALRNPVRHKRIVDYYRYQETETTITEGDVVFDNLPPEANDNSFTVDQDSADNLLDVLANDSDPDGDELTIVGVTQPGNGVVEIGQGQLVYTPAVGFVGTETFEYTVDDGFGGQSSAQVTVVVQPLGEAPEASDINVATQRTVAVEVDVLGAVTNPDGLNIEIADFTQPGNGTVTRIGNRLEYQPEQLFFGDDQFFYTIVDARGRESTAAVNVDVAFANQAPVARPDTASTPANVPITVDVLANDFDPDGDPIELVSIERISFTAAEAEINADGTVTVTVPETCSGRNRFVYTIEDPFGATASAVLTVNREPTPGDEGSMGIDDDSSCDS